MRRILIAQFTICILFSISCNQSPVNNKTIEPGIVENNSNSHLKLKKVETIVFETELGWGYDVIIDKKVYIHQAYIPAINGLKSFSSAEDAKKVAQFLVGKIKKLQKLPSISYYELDSLKVL